MTDTDQATVDQPPRKADQDPLESLTIRELDAGSRLLHHDLMEASMSGHYLRPAAMAITAYLLARREADNPKTVKLATFREMTLEQLANALGFDVEDQAAEADQADDDELAAQLLDGADDVDPVDPPGPLDDQAALLEAVAADPTASTAGPSSPACGEASIPVSSGT